MRVADVLANATAVAGRSSPRARRLPHSPRTTLDEPPNLIRIKSRPDAMATLSGKP